jgi:hypothetical protein
LLGALLYLNRSLPNEAVDERGLLFEEEPLDDLLSLRLFEACEQRGEESSNHNFGIGHQSSRAVSKEDARRE